MDSHPVATSDSAFGSRNGDVDGVWNSAGQIVELKSAGVRDGGVGIRERKPGCNDMLMNTGMEMTNPIHAAADPLVLPAWASMVLQRAAVHTYLYRPLRGEIARLGLSSIVEQVMIDVRNMSAYTPHASDMDAERRWLRPSLPLNQGQPPNTPSLSEVAPLTYNYVTTLCTVSGREALLRHDAAATLVHPL